MANHGKEVRRRRREKGLTHAEVCTASGLGLNTLIDVELGRVNITKFTFDKIMTVIEALPDKERAA